MNAQQPEWVQVLFEKLGPDVMSKSSNELTGEDLFNIYHLTKNINGADDGVFPMIETFGDKVIPVLEARLSDTDTPQDELETAKEIVYIFFPENEKLRGLSGN